MPRGEALIHEAIEYIESILGRDHPGNHGKSKRLSSFYFSKIFKQYRGVTFIDYLTSFRVSRAKELLKDLRWSIKEISCKVGYPDSNYFTRVFKRLEGLTPTEYRCLGEGTEREQKFQENSKT